MRWNVHKTSVLVSTAMRKIFQWTKTNVLILREHVKGCYCVYYSYVGPFFSVTGWYGSSVNWCRGRLGSWHWAEFPIVTTHLLVIWVSKKSLDVFITNIKIECHGISKLYVCLLDIRSWIRIKLSTDFPNLPYIFPSSDNIIFLLPHGG